MEQDKEQIIYNKGILTSTLGAVVANIEKIKSEIFFLYDETLPDDETKNDLDMVLIKLAEAQEEILTIVKKNSADSDSYMSYM